MSDTALVLKYIHIIGAIVLFGTGMGTAFHGLASNLSRNIQAIAIANRNVVWADWLFTTPAVILQPITGLWLAHENGWPLDTPWLMVSIGLYIFIGACWLPVVWLQVRMHKMSVIAARDGAALPALYYTYFRWWFALGWPAFIGIALLLWFMIARPPLW
jgi:uncharacterized membrane protein